MKIIIGLLLVLLTTGTAFSEIVTVVTPKAKMRSSPAAGGSSIVMTVKRHYPLSVQDEQGRYLFVRDFEGRSGWIHQTLVDKTPGIVVEVNGANVRQGPGKEHPVVFQAFKGDVFEVTDETETWLQIVGETGRQGWIYRPLTWGR